MSDEADRLVAAALRYARAGFLIHPLDEQTRPLVKGWQDSSTRDPEEIRRQFADPRAAGVGYLLGNGTFRTKDELGRECDYDLGAIDIDDGQEGLDQLATLTEELRAGSADYHPDYGTANLPETLTIATPSGNEQRVFIYPTFEREGPIGCRLNTSLELKAASKDGRPISGRLPPTYRAPKGDKPGGCYTFKRKILPDWLPYIWEERFLDLANSIRKRDLEIADRSPPVVVGDYERGEALRALKASCRMISATRTGRFWMLNNETLKIGHYDWALDGQEARNQLAAAARRSGWRGDIARVIRTAYADGAREPRDVRRSTLHAGGRARVRTRRRIDEPMNHGEQP